MTEPPHDRSQSSPAAPPIALTVAGSDGSGGAGIQADLKTFTAFGVYGASAIVALTAQNTHGVTGVHPVPVPFVAEQIDRIAEDLTIGATKTGMLATADIVETVVAALVRHRLAPLVVDPVMVATSGDALLAADAVEAVRRRLIPRAALVTPNLHEAAALLDAPVATSVEDMAWQGEAIRSRFGPRAVLVKGGHGFGPEAVDVLVEADGTVHRLTLPRLPIDDAHGTGCTLSAAITALLAAGVAMPDAVRRAKTYLWRALASAELVRVGHGARPVDHLFAIRRQEPPA
jgi:hydroxymethylpyrimidine/phosphomethylpyrimidine kinase